MQASDKRIPFRGVISLTTHAGRAAHIAPVVESLVRQGEVAGLRVCLCVEARVASLLPDSVREMADRRRMEILIDRRDHGSAMKFTLAMRKWRDVPIIAVDDDNVFWEGTLAGMMLWHSRLPGVILCRRWREITWGPDGRMLPFTFKGFPLHDCRALPPGHVRHVVNGFPEHCAGVLYPPGCFLVTDADIDENLEKSPHDDDVFAHILALRHGVETFQIHDPAYLKEQRDRIDPALKATGLWRNGGNGARSTEALRRYEAELAKAREERP